MAKQVKAFRNISGGIVPTIEVQAGAAITTGYGTPVALQSDGYYDACADAATAMDGWLVGGQSGTTIPGAAAEGDTIVIVEARPGIQALMKTKGTSAITLPGSFIALDLTTSVYKAEVDKADADVFKLIEYFDDVAGTEYAWVEVISTAGTLAEH